MSDRMAAIRALRSMRMKRRPEAESEGGSDVTVTVRRVPLTEFGGATGGSEIIRTPEEAAELADEDEDDE